MTLFGPLTEVPGSTPAQRRMLAPAHGPVQPPIRSEIFGPERFAQHGRSLAETHRAQRSLLPSATFFPRLRSNIRMLRAAHRYIGSQSANGYDISPAAEWLLDNFHLIEAQLKEIHDGLPRGYFRALPVLQDAPLAGLPRVYGVAWAFVAHTDGDFDEELLVHFLGAYEQTRELTLGEMWALPTTLRVVLIENLRRLAERVAANKAARELANLCCDHIAACPVPLLARLLEALNQRGVGRVFLAQMAQRWQDLGAAPALQLATAQQLWLGLALPDPASVLAQQTTDQAADNLSVGNALTSLRAISDTDWSDIIARTSPLMRLMLTSAVFASEHALTRDQTLHGIEQLARRSGRGETEVAQALLALMHAATASTDDPDPAHTSMPIHWLRGPGQGALLRALAVPPGSALRVRLAWQATLQALAVPLYLGTLALATAALMAWLLRHHGAGPLAWAWLTLPSVVLLLVPASEAVVAVVNRLISESAHPRPLPRLALAGGIPPEHRVMVVIPAMLTQAASTRTLVHRLLLHHLANPEANAQFALLTDWADADAPQAPADDSLLADALREIEGLNALHPLPPAADTLAAPPPRFILLHRVRRFSPSEQRWIGWERKRGKLEMLVAALAGGSAAEFLDLGESSRIAPETRYIVTLDSDTQLPPGRLRELVGVAAHPHNQPRLSADGRQVLSGWGILQPRVMTPLPAPAQLTRFHTLFAGQCGIDPYSAASSEVYQDVFGEGSFTGKGLLHVATMHAMLAERLPEGQVLSHDLLEGALARCAAVSDIAVIEDAPFHADVAAARVHRWTRGDWQLLPFLLQPGRVALGAIHRWKLLDNLRRSLVAPTSLALLLLALAGQVLAPWAALGLVLAAFTAGPLMGALAGLLPQRNDLAVRHFLRRALGDLARALLAGTWLLAQLLQQAINAVDAIVRALYRTSVSHRHLLQWTTTATTEASTRPGLVAALRRHWSESAVAAVLWLGLWAVHTPYPMLAGALCLLWGASPLWTWWASRTPAVPDEAELSPQAQAELAGIARDTWRYFERSVTADDQHLPPDNLQTHPQDMLAHRTSPTNIGLYLLSVACAREFGWIGTQDLLSRMEATLATLDRLQRHRGHFLNWYDTQSAAPLLPMYVSTVDSGNLGGHLLAVAQACLALAHAPHDPSASQRALQASRERLAPWLANRHRLTPALKEQLRWALDDHRATRQSARLDARANMPSLLAEGLRGARQRLHAVAQRCTALAFEADYGFLYHRKRHLFHIGYRLAEQTLDASYYDLLASESRLTGLLAIAKGDVPVNHWAALGRPFFAVGAQAGLRSWSGSMFEYLMPTLVLDEPHGSVLRDAGEAALREQMAYTRDAELPWGLSESAYADRDNSLAYQYAPQGVPRLALRRTPSNELVIAPYATALAAQVAPKLALQNFAALQALGARGRYGYIEALDFTPTRQTGTARYTPVCTFMAHHQGMSIVALANVLLGGVAQRWGMASASIQAVASVLHERSPREVSKLYQPPPGPQPLAQQRQPLGLVREVLPGAQAVPPTHVLSNGRYRVALRANGAGWSRWGGTDINRWRDDALRDAHGSFVYLRWDRQPQPVSISQHPAPDPQAQYRSVFHADRVSLEAAWPELQAQTTVWVCPEDDIEFRQVELRNLSDRTLDIELISAFEVSLAPAAADEAHPAFSKLFVRAEWLAAQQALLFSRTPRLPSEPAVQMAHFLAHSSAHSSTDTAAEVLALHVQTDRQAWLGRNRAVGQPLADLQVPPDDGSGTPQPLATGLDPVCAMAVQLRIAPRAKATLTFATAASDQAGVLRAVIDKYRQPSHVQRASLMSGALAGMRLRELRLGADEFAAVQSLSTALLLSLARPPVLPAALQPPQASPATPAANATEPPGPACDRRLLWRHGLSGDRPIVLVAAGASQGLGLLRTLAQALRLWSWGGVGCDLVVVNAEADSYHMALQRELAALRQKHLAESAAQPSPDCTGFHLLRAADLSDDELGSLLSLARVRLQADGRPLLHHVLAWNEWHEQALAQRSETSTSALAEATGPAETVAAPLGEFADDGSGGFSFEVSAASRPARPWINVLSNPAFGTHVSEAGAGCTWAVNSRLNQLTAWSNDPVADPAAECFWLQDLRNLATWSLSPGAGADPALRYSVSHGQGHSRISHRRGDLAVVVTWCVDADVAVKQVQVRITNHAARTQHLRLVGLVEWLMGANRTDRNTVHTAQYRQRLPDQVGPDGAPQARKLTALLATQRESSAGFGQGTAFLALAGSGDKDWTCDRRECFDARGRSVLPDHFGQQAGEGLDPCAALSVAVRVPAGATLEKVFLLGYAESPDAARLLATQAATRPADQRLREVQQRWNDLLGATTVSTPDPLFNALVNRWLLYQTVACRLWAKAGFYQAGGATGFRDQLQDTLALAWAAPAMLHAQIVRCAARQFPEGDVQHWWHAPTGAGVRTRFSDDLLWLPHACVRYLHATGDANLLDVRVPFIEGDPVPEHAEDLYATPEVSRKQATVYEHAARTLDLSLRVGAHGLPLMGSGDWNDGMNRVGAEGHGESVWLGWFLCRLVADFAPWAHARGDTLRAQRWEQAAVGWQAALLGPAWDGHWFKRAFFDDGSPLGSHTNTEARIDLIAQAWSVLSGVAPHDMQRMALDAMETLLVDPAAGLLRLLDPPLQTAQPSAGYIQAYPPGVRENGGQYTHAGVWALMARAQAQTHPATRTPQGDDQVWRDFMWLSPAHRAANAQQGHAYGLEPYAVAGDVYSQPPYTGRGGWSWYTGAAAWLHRAAIESLFGLQQGAQTLHFQPCLPTHWPRAELTLRRDDRSLRFILLRATPMATQAEAECCGARVLLVGEVLNWTEQPRESRFVVPLLSELVLPARAAETA